LRRSSIFEFVTTMQPIDGEKTRLRQKRMQDAVNEYYWRKDDELCQLDAAKPTTSTFEEYIHWYAHDQGLANDSCVLAIETMDGKHIGSCGCFNIDDGRKELELGILIGEKEFWNQGYGYDAISTLISKLFNDTDLKRIYLKTLDWNIRAHKCFQKCGFREFDKLVQGGHRFLVMELKRRQLEV
jgi:RimJ/RimL family protein N-acetyltransferase